MALRWHLAQFLAGEPCGSDELRRRVEALHVRLDSALEQSG